MTEKLTKLLDLACDALALYIHKTTAELGGAPPIVEKPVKGRKPRLPKAVEPAPTKEPESPFGTLGGAKEPEAVVALIEDQAEAKRRCQEVMGLFIRRYLKAQPTGLDRAKAILTKVCGRPIAKLEDLTHADNVRLIPVFEAELEEADAEQHGEKK